MSYNPNNWAHGKNKPYRAGIRANKVPEKTAEWDAKRIGYKRIES